MKKNITIIGIVILFFSISGFATYKAYESGLIEEKVSKMKIPFNWFYNYDLENVRELEVSNSGTVNIESYKNSLKIVSDKFSLNNKDRPNIDDSNFDKDSINYLNKTFDSIYGVDNTYISQFIVSGISQTKNGWGPLLTISVLDDTEQVKNITFSSFFKDGKIESVNKVSETVDSFWYSEIPNDYKQSMISSGITSSKNYIENEVYKTSTIKISDNAKELFKFINNSRMSAIYAYSSNQVIEIKYSIGTDTGIKEVTFNYDPIDDVILNIN